MKKLKSLCSVAIAGSLAYQFIYYKKDFDGYYTNVLQPLSQYLSPEWAHKIGVAAIKYGFFPPAKADDPLVLKTKFLDYELNNPIGIAAGFDKNGDAVIGLRKLGFSIVEIGSVTPDAQPGNPKPRVFRLPEDKAVINRYGFNSEGHDEVYKKIDTIEKSLLDKGLLGINLGKNKLSDNPIEDYVLGIKKFSNLADYFVINISSPNTPGLRSLQKKEELYQLLKEVNKARNDIKTTNNPPLLLKLAPDLSNEEMNEIVSVILKKESKVDGLIISNTTIDRPQLKNTEFPNEAGGLSGKPLTVKSTEMIKQMYKMTKGKVPIVGVGGVFTGQDAYDKILAGASAVQIYTALIYHGPPVVSKIMNELAELLQRDGYNNVNEAVGKGIQYKEKKLKSLCSVAIAGSLAYQFIYYKKDFDGYYTNVLQPLSQYLSPEWAHKIGVAAIKYGFFPPAKADDPLVLKTKFLDYELNNPIGIAAGFDKNGDAVIGLRKLGFSIVEIGSVTPDAQPGNPKPRVFRLPEDKAVINRYGFNSEGHDEVYKKIDTIEKSLLDKGLLGINLGKNKLSDNPIEDYVLGIKKFSNLADYFVINISSPNTPGLRSLQKKEELYQLLKEVNKARNDIKTTNNPPLLLKLAPDLSNEEMNEIVSVILKKESKVEGLIISNTTIDRPQLKNTEFPNEAGGLSGKPLTVKSTEMIKQMYKITKGKVPIVGVGGVFTGQDAYDKILAGASAVQIYTALIYHGPPVVSKIKNELAELLQRDENLVNTRLTMPL